VREVPGPGPKTTYHRVVKGEMPSWLPVALNLLKDSKRHLSDREIAKRVGVATSTLSRNPAYRRAKRTFAQSLRAVVRGGGDGVWLKG
jgi:hypothetical protein